VYNWVAIRAKDKPFWPGKYDQMVAGGQGIGIGLMDNVIKESAEEADIPIEIASQAQQRTTLSYCLASHRGLNINTLFNYDLWLPEDFTPVNTDGEVDEFILMPLEQVAEIIDTTDQFKANCNLVTIDLLIRSGVINDSHVDFKAITDLLYTPAIPLN
jgi:isopentenyldiphosphate isomerase